MATKRQAPDDTTSRPSSSSSSWKRRKPNAAAAANNHNSHLSRAHHGKNSFKKAHAVNDLKSTIRSLGRLLSRKGGDDVLPAGVRVEKERQLRTAQRELERQQRAKKRSSTIARWHKVRFFERQKAERRLRRARKALREAAEGNSTGGEAGEEEEEVWRTAAEECEVEVAYAVYFPLERDYVPLFRKMRDGEGGPEDGEEKVVERQGDKEMWEIVKRCMKEGTLQDLREGRLEKDEDKEVPEEATIKSVKREKKKKRIEDVGGEIQKSRAQRRTEMHNEDESGDESGGGFFE